MANVTVGGGVLILALMAAGLTEATLALGPHGRLTNSTALRPATPTPTPTATPTPTVVPTPTPTPVPTATPVPVRTATTNGFVHMRASNTTSSAILIDLNAGTRVELLAYSDNLWQQVRYSGYVGYIWKGYLAY